MYTLCNTPIKIYIIDSVILWYSEYSFHIDNTNVQIENTFTRDRFYLLKLFSQ